ncbi:MAG: hypothetical protein HKN64_05280 [Woeseiaceae bacterium]|nr:hypothetical protein [Woeseiaceae bacterium]
MSNERKSPDMDTLVAQTYKALATERAPDHLNAKVMAMAAREAQTRSGPARTWIRPLAWAATIGLSLAIVLDLTQLPTPPVDSRDPRLPPQPAVTPADPAARTAPQAVESSDNTGIDVSRDKAAVSASKADDAAVQEALLQDRDALPEAEERTRSQAGSGRPAIGAPPEPSMIDPVIKTRQESEAEPVEMEPATTTGNRPDAVASTPRASEETARGRAQAGESLAASTFSAVSEAPWPESDRPCPAKLRESAESWLSCIAELRDKDLFDLADYEAGEFERKYPSYHAPAADK